MSSDQPSVFDLSQSEKLQLVEDLWDDLAATSESVPLHDWHRAELDRRCENLQRHPRSGLTWEHAQRRVQERHGR